MSHQRLVDRLRHGDRRSLRGVPSVLRAVRRDPRLFGVLIGGMWHDDPLVRMRSADAVEKLTVEHPRLLRPYKRRLLDLASTAQQPEVRWHVAQLVSRLSLSSRERSGVVRILYRYLDDESRIVKTCAMQALADIAETDPERRPGIIATLRALTSTGSPAMKSRGRALLGRLGAAGDLGPVRRSTVAGGGPTRGR